MKTWHIFSRAIDNFGDVAISLRLARQLSNQTNCQIILFTEFNSTLETLVPGVVINSKLFVSG